MIIIHGMKAFHKILVVWLLISSMAVNALLPEFFFIHNKSTDNAFAQTTIDTIKAKITTVVNAADGKITLVTKNKLIEIISNKIKASPNATITEIYIHFLREVKKLRTIDEIINLWEWTFILSPSSQPSSQTVSSQTTTSVWSSWLPDFSISFATAQGTIQQGDKFVNLSIKLKNMGKLYKPDWLGSLKFGCKGVDGKIYPYRSYTDNQIIDNQNDVTIDVPNVYIGNLTTSKWLKLLMCKIDSSDLISESNEENNTATITISLF